jgi:ribonuclease HI
MHNVELFTDGSCKGNGQADGGRGGWSAILVCGDHRKQLTGARTKRPTIAWNFSGLFLG